MEDKQTKTGPEERLKARNDARGLGDSDGANDSGGPNPREEGRGESKSHASRRKTRESEKP